MTTLSAPVTADERRQFSHDHAEAYEAAELLAQRLEMVGHDREAALVRALRRRLARHISDGDCRGD